MERPGVANGGQALGVQLDLSRRSRARAALRVVDVVFEGDERNGLHWVAPEAHFEPLLERRCIAVGSRGTAVLFVAGLHPVLPGFALGELVAQPEALGEIGDPIIRETAFELRFLDRAAEDEAESGSAGHGGNHVHAFLVHEIGQDDVAEGQ